MKNKKLQVYEEKYGHIDKDFNSRFITLLKTLKITDKDMRKIKERIKEILRIRKKTLSFVFYFTPQATPRPRYSKFTKSFYVKNQLDYNKLFKEYLDNEDIKIKIVTPCEFKCVTYMPTPSGMNRTEKVLAELGLIKNISKPDWDNLGKTYSDMIQKHLILDDAIIYKGTSEKLYSGKPRIEITLTYYEDFDSKYNRTKIMKNKYFNE